MSDKSLCLQAFSLCRAKKIAVSESVWTALFEPFGVRGAPVTPARPAFRVQVWLRVRSTGQRV